MKVWLVGVNHRIQWSNSACQGEWVEDIRKFEDYLVRIGTEHDVDLFAEEFSEEALATSDAERCTVHQASSRLRRPHLFCDPDSGERLRHGISTDDEREAFWLRQLCTARVERVLYVCGDCHVDSFAARLRDADFCAKVLSRGWGEAWQLRS